LSFPKVLEQPTLAEREQLEASIAALESQRHALGDALVDMALGPLRARLAGLRASDQRLKVVTVLFVDIVGSTPLSRQLDPEDIHAIIDGALQRFTTLIELEQGRVLQYAGDSLLAVFGADEAHEDDPERAVRAGLSVVQEAKRIAAQILERHGHSGFNVRAGTDTGRVLLGGGVDADGTIRGTTVNIAARMEQTAPTGGLRISHDTYRHVRGVFDASEQPPIRIKGCDTPIRTYLVTSAKARALRVPSRGIEGVHARMVGRETELHELQETFQATTQARRASHITVVAEAGLGKTRLLAAFDDWSKLQSQPVWWFEARANEHQRDHPYGLLRDLFTWHLRILDSDVDSVAQARLMDGVAPVLGSERDAAVLGHLIGFDFSAHPAVSGILDDSKQLHDRGFHYATQYFRRLAADGRPVLLMLDDLHWADDGSLDFVDDLLAVNGDAPLLVIGFTRPPLLERRPLWSSGKGSHRRIDLAPLSPRNSQELAGVLLQKLPEVPNALSEMITGNSEGNPFHMEELVKMLIDDGVIVTGERWELLLDKMPAVRVPSTLIGVLQARLDALPPEERSALQLAAVAGHVFWDQALDMLDSGAPNALEGLLRRELICARGVSSLEGAKEFIFKHHTLHQVIYDSILKYVKREAHAKVAAWLAAQRGALRLDLIAEHYERAGENVIAAQYWQGAAEEAARRHAHGAALMHAHRALAHVSSTDTARRYALALVRAKALFFQGDRQAQAENVAELERLAELLGDKVKQYEAAMSRAFFLERVSDFARALAVAQQALVKYTPSEKVNAARAHDIVSYAHLRLGQYTAAQEHALAGLTAAGRAGEKAVEASLLTLMGMIASEWGDPVTAPAIHEQALAGYQEVGDRFGEARALGNIGDAQRVLGRYAIARGRILDSLRLCKEIGNRPGEGSAYGSFALLALNEGDWASARVYAEAALPILRAMGDRWAEASVLVGFGHAELALGQFESARECYAASRNLFDALGIQHKSLEPIAGMAEAALTEGDVAGALAQVEIILARVAAGAEPGCTRESWCVGLTSHRVLIAAGDSRAPDMLATAHSELQARAERISDPDARQCFLHTVMQHRVQLL
jgi:predicted ATPase/class 3 adenylate cyclase